MTEQKCDKMKFNIPKYEIEALARAFLPAVLNYYRTEEGKKEFEICQGRKINLGTGIKR